MGVADIQAAPYYIKIGIFFSVGNAGTLLCSNTGLFTGILNSGHRSTISPIHKLEVFWGTESKCVYPAACAICSRCFTLLNGRAGSVWNYSRTLVCETDPFYATLRSTEISQTEMPIALRKGCVIGAMTLGKPFCSAKKENNVNQGFVSYGFRCVNWKLHKLRHSQAVVLLYTFAFAKLG